MAGHTHPVIDTDVRFRIDAVSRKIQAESGKTALIQGDHNSERYTFELPRCVDGHDLSLCNVAEVHYINTASSGGGVSKDVYSIDDLMVSPDNAESVVCSWLIHGNAAVYAGKLDFALKFKCVASDGSVEYVWNTAIYSGVSVSQGIDNIGAIIENNPDILHTLHAEIEKLKNSGGGSAKRVTEVDLLAADWQTEKDGKYFQLKEVPTVTELSRLEVTFDDEQLEIMQDKVFTFYAQHHGDGVAKIYVYGDMPTKDYTVQITVEEVIWIE